jgi:hypothetical protein
LASGLETQMSLNPLTKLAFRRRRLYLTISESFLRRADETIDQILFAAPPARSCVYEFTQRPDRSCRRRIFVTQNSKSGVAGRANAVLPLSSLAAINSGHGGSWP